MDFIKQHRNQNYIGVTIAAVILALVLCLDFKIRRDAERNEAAMTATTIKEKEKKDKVVISVSTDTIQDGLANMGVLITQEYYFTQVEKYTKEKTFLKFITSSSEFMYSYDGAVMAGIDFEKIEIKTDEDRKIITVDMPDSEIQAVTIDKDTFSKSIPKRILCGTRSNWRITIFRLLSLKTRPRKRQSPAAFLDVRMSRLAISCASLFPVFPTPESTLSHLQIEG